MTVTFHCYIALNIAVKYILRYWPNVTNSNEKKIITELLFQYNFLYIRAVTNKFPSVTNTYALNVFNLLMKKVESNLRKSDVSRG